MIEIANTYLSEGLGAIPLKANKSPMLPEGHPYLYKPVEDEKVDELFMRAEKIGIACGMVSGGFFAIDFDGHNGEPIAKIFNEFLRNDAVKAVVDKHKLPIFRTMSGGFHIYFKYENLAYGGHSIAKWETGKVMIEVRGNGQYICVAPSEGYKQLSGTEIIKTSTITQEEKDVLFQVAETFNQFVQNEETKGSGKWPERFNVEKNTGRYNEYEAEHAKGLLIEAGWQHVRTGHINGIEYWLRPGKEYRENGTPAHSATYGNKHNMFFVFSSSAAPFGEWKGYTHFDILLKLKFNDDLKAAMKFLEDRYAPTISIAPTPDQDIEPEYKPIPNFPIEVFPEGVAKYITALNECLNYSPDFLALSAMFAVSVCNGNKTKLRVKNGWIAPSIFWFAIVGEPGTMKSHPVSMMIKPINDIDKASKIIYDGEMSEWLKIEKERRPEKPKFKQILISDYTLEALHNVHDFNKRGIGLYKDELVGFLNDMNKYRKGSDEQFWLESFNNKSYVVNRVTKEPIFIDDININMIGTLQPSVLSNIVKEFTGNGLVDRFLYSRAERQIYPMSRLDIKTDWIRWWDERIKEANTYYRYTDKLDTQILEITDAAMDLFYQYDLELLSMQQSDGMTINMKGYLNKMKTYLPRFALVMVLFDTIFEGLSQNVDVDHMKRAWNITQYFIESAKAIFNEAESRMEISQVTASMFGKTKKEKIVALYSKGFKQSEICKELNCPKQYVHKVLTEK